jgi:hypothetical protein
MKVDVLADTQGYKNESELLARITDGAWAGWRVQRAIEYINAIRHSKYLSARATRPFAPEHGS